MRWGTLSAINWRCGNGVREHPNTLLPRTPANDDDDYNYDYDYYYNYNNNYDMCNYYSSMETGDDTAHFQATTQSRSVPRLMSRRTEGTSSITSRSCFGVLCDSGAEYKTTDLLTYLLLLLLLQLVVQTISDAQQRLDWTGLDHLHC